MDKKHFDSFQQAISLEQLNQRTFLEESRAVLASAPPGRLFIRVGELLLIMKRNPIAVQRVGDNHFGFGAHQNTCQRFMDMFFRIKRSFVVKGGLVSGNLLLFSESKHISIFLRQRGNEGIAVQRLVSVGGLFQNGEVVAADLYHFLRQLFLGKGEERIGIPFQVAAAVGPSAGCFFFYNLIGRL